MEIANLDDIFKHPDLEWSDGPLVDQLLEKEIRPSQIAPEALIVQVQRRRQLFGSYYEKEYGNGS
jgi:hypothetical protein